MNCTPNAHCPAPSSIERCSSEWTSPSLAHPPLGSTERAILAAIASGIRRWRTLTLRVSARSESSAPGVHRVVLLLVNPALCPASLHILHAVGYSLLHGLAARTLPPCSGGGVLPIGHVAFDDSEVALLACATCLHSPLLALGIQHRAAIPSAHVDRRRQVDMVILCLPPPILSNCPYYSTRAQGKSPVATLQNPFQPVPKLASRPASTPALHKASAKTKTPSSRRWPRKNRDEVKLKQAEPVLLMHLTN